MRAGQVIHIEPAAPAKPALGAPCNGCGVCCLAEPCPLGRVISRKRVGACEALRWDGSLKIYRCGAITDAAGVLGERWAFAAPLLRRLARRWIAAGAGATRTSMWRHRAPDASPPVPHPRGKGSAVL